MIIEKCYDLAHRKGPLVARILIGGMFLIAGIHKIFGFEGTQAYIESVSLPFPALMVVLAILFEVLGGLSLILGYKIKYGATALIIFTIITSLSFHTNFSGQLQMTMFIKNMAIIGGLFYMTAFGAGHIAMDKKDHMHQQTLS